MPNERNYRTQSAKSTHRPRIRLSFVLLIIQTVATEKLKAALWATLHVTADMVNTTRCYVAIMTALTPVLIGVRYLGKHLSVWELYRLDRARDRCRILHFTSAMTANGHRALR